MAPHRAHAHLTGLPDEVEAAADRIGRVLTVLEVSKPYPRRGDSRLVSLYLDAESPAESGCADSS